MNPLTHPARRVVAIMAIAFLLTGCLLGSGGDKRYRLLAPEVDPAVGGQHAPADTVLAISRPHTDRTRDSSRVLVRRGRSLMPWPGVAWIDRAPEVLQGLLVETLDGRVATVGRHGSVPRDYRLDLDLRRFELVERGEGLSAELVLAARLVDASGELVAATTVVERGHSAASSSIDDALAALEDALGSGIGQLADWLGGRLARD